MSMGRFLVRRTLVAIPVMLGVIFFTFVLIRATPGGPFDMAGGSGRVNSPQIIARLEAQFGMDKPVLEQFFNYLGGLLRLDFGPALGRAYRDENVLVQELVAERLPISIQVGIYSVLLAFLIGIPLGVLAAVYHNTAIDYTSMFIAVLGVSIPNLVLAPMLIWIFAVKLDVLPVADVDGVWRSTIDDPAVMFSWDYISLALLPVFALGTGMSTTIARLTRASLLQVLNEDYIRTARAKGLKEWVVIYGHALKNSLIPIATLIGPLLAGILTGTFIIERIFNIPGAGAMFISALAERDYNIMLGVTIIYSLFLVAGNIFVDVLYTWLDPRIRFS